MLMSFGKIFGTVFGAAGGKGYAGELKVSLRAWLALPKSTYRPLHNVTLPAPDGTTQIDHIFVSRYGVFVVETKNMGGWIFGARADRYWTQAFKGRSNFRFQNPLRQNYRHVKAVERTLSRLGLSRDIIHSVVVFAGDARLKTEMPTNVTVGRNFTAYIRSFRKTVLSEQQASAAFHAIQSECLSASADMHRQHLRDVSERKRHGAPLRCPRCGKDMMLRTVRRGPNVGRQFWGCSGFPACRYTTRHGKCP